MKILYIAPLPPPMAGHSLVAKVFYDELIKNNDIRLVNFNKKSFKEGINSVGRILEILHVLYAIWRKKKGVDVIYLTISESLAGNLKDLFIYLICFGKLPKTYIHLHGGTIKKELWDRYDIIFRLNKLLIQKMAGVIISGGSHMEIFQDIVSSKKMHIVPNFALEHLFVSETEIKTKFSTLKPLRILYMSNMIEKKGYNDLADACLKLDSSIKNQIKVDFVGRFENESQQASFLNQTSDASYIQYHGVVNEIEKKRFFLEAHIFCLPTVYLEGQPVSILEAYASGCVVLTTGQPGILDIFTPGLNGYQIVGNSPESIKNTITKIVNYNGDLLRIALTNRNQAGEKYKVSIYNSTLLKIVTAPIVL